MITYLESDKFNIAWFKLAEFVARKEKERALGMYRLLAHSMTDQALAAQLQGDLLLAFNDDRALEAYLKAAELYEKEGKLVQAVAVCEHTAAMMPHCALEYFMRLSYLCERMGENNKACHYASLAVSLVLSKESLNYLLQYIEATACSAEHRLTLLEQTVLEVLTAEQRKQEDLSHILEQLVQGLIKLGDSKRLTTFMTLLASLQPSLHEYARDCLRLTATDGLQI